MKVVPVPGALARWMEPPCATTISLRDVESEAEPAEVFRGCGALETREDPLLIGGLYPDALVSDREARALGVGADLHGDRFRLTELDGVREQVRDHLLEA